MPREIPLTQGKVALVDDADYPLVSQFSWQAAPDKHTWYARNSENARMHHMICPPPVGYLTDHKDGNGLNNTRANLRIATHQQNCANRRLRCDSQNRYKGIERLSPNRWRAIIGIDGKTKYLGSYKTDEAAARAYDAAARTYFGEFARVNFP
jgi:hypothetical protein